jgi:hypothetical protein
MHKSPHANRRGGLGNVTRALHIRMNQLGRAALHPASQVKDRVDGPHRQGDPCGVVEGTLEHLDSGGTHGASAVASGPSEQPHPVATLQQLFDQGLPHEAGAASDQDH